MNATFIIYMMLGILHQAVKNPEKAAALKVDLLQVRDAINALYYPAD